jgi:hypothetical protein
MKRIASNGAIVALSASALAFAGVVVFRAVPSMRATEERMIEAGTLVARAGSIEAIEHRRDEARARLDEVRLRADRVLRAIPTTPDQAHLMRMLALGSSADVGTQTIVAGDALPATNGAAGLKAVPITIEMRASFAKVIELLCRAEGDRRLVRPIGVEITRTADAKSDDAVPLVDARIELDAVYGVADAKSPAGGEP